MKKLVNCLAYAASLTLACVWGFALGWGLRNDASFLFLGIVGATGLACLEGIYLRDKVAKLERD